MFDMLKELLCILGIVIVIYMIIAVICTSIEEIQKFYIGQDKIKYMKKLKEDIEKTTENK